MSFKKDMITVVVLDIMFVVFCIIGPRKLEAVTVVSGAVALGLITLFCILDGLKFFEKHKVIKKVFFFISLIIGVVALVTGFINGHF